jgi:hypothetical protein
MLVGGERGAAGAAPFFIIYSIIYSIIYNRLFIAG